MLCLLTGFIHDVFWYILLSCISILVEFTVTIKSTSHLVNATEVVHMLTLSGPLHSLDKFKVSTVQSRGHQCNTLIYNPYLKYYNSETEHKM